MWQPLARPRPCSQHATPISAAAAAAVCYINETEHMQNYPDRWNFCWNQIAATPLAPFPAALATRCRLLKGLCAKFPVCSAWLLGPLPALYGSLLPWLHIWYCIMCACVSMCVCVGLLDLPWLKIATNKNHANLKPRKWLGKRQTMLPAIWPKCFYSITHVNYASFT